MIGGSRLLLYYHRMRSETRLCSSLKIDPPEKTRLFRVREIFRYHSRGCLQSLIRDKDRSQYHGVLACDHLPQALGINCRLWLARGLGDFLRRFFFAPGEEPFNHVKRYWNKKNRDSRCGDHSSNHR
jgi:hypothetical protein